MSKKTVALTDEQFHNIINAMREGSMFFKPNNRIAMCLILEANLGMRIGDILQMKLNSIIRDGDRYRLNVVETKTKKDRTFTVPLTTYVYIKNYCLENNIGPDELIFKIKVRAVQKYLKKVVDYLGYENISTHSFRKTFATKAYNESGYNIVLVQNLLQHSSAATTQRYIGISTAEVEDTLAKITMLV